MIEQKTPKTNPVAITFEEAFNFLKIESVMKKLDFDKRSGISCWDLFLIAFGSVFNQAANIFRFFQMDRAKDAGCSRDTVYRFMKDPHHNFRGLQKALATKIIKKFTELNSSIKEDVMPCFILDDTMMERIRGKKVEFLSYQYDHVFKRNRQSLCQPGSVPD